ncbi:aminotransferase class IV [Calycomorphotria hydatis]|uniref:branched-chain-amino-acid transaminase n=1 Tax=Calycomorphotria hydatis TaxID=2528027 RepID=A0A517T7R7_9PLAN|nr:aminotransferase class IV [Calycomorphotria hydatis]QDT64412.1 putative branched-chain-amino-acid aminotransferase [Calycomorphotria hydatis]
MSEETGVAWINGTWGPLSKATLPIADFSVTAAATVTEIIRTFQHQPFRLEEHLQRLEQSATAARVPLRLNTGEISALVAEGLQQVESQVLAEQDMVISVFASPGVNTFYAGGQAPPDPQPTLCLSLFPLDMSPYQKLREAGQHLAVPDVMALPAEVLSPSIKTRSRLHWYLADRLAAETFPGARALLADVNGYVTETSAGNVFAVFGEDIKCPLLEKTLQGISQRYVMELLSDAGTPVTPTDLTVDELLSADEVFTSSSLYCLLPVTRVNGHEIGGGKPGVVYRRLLDRWSDAIGVAIAEQ